MTSPVSSKADRGTVAIVRPVGGSFLGSGGPHLELDAVQYARVMCGPSIGLMAVAVPY
jgi:hypothetical protein